MPNKDVVSKSGRKNSEDSLRNIQSDLSGASNADQIKNHSENSDIPGGRGRGVRQRSVRKGKKANPGAEISNLKEKYDACLEKGSKWKWPKRKYHRVRFYYMYPNNKELAEKKLEILTDIAESGLEWEVLQKHGINDEEYKQWSFEDPEWARKVTKVLNGLIVDVAKAGVKEAKAGSLKHANDVRQRVEKTLGTGAKTPMKMVDWKWLESAYGKEKTDLFMEMFLKSQENEKLLLPAGK